MTEPLKPHVLNNLERRAHLCLEEGGRFAGARIPAHMLASLIAEVREFRRNEIWTLTVEEDRTTTTIVLASQEGAFKALRANYDPEGDMSDLSDGDMIQGLIDQDHLVIYLEQHTAPKDAST